MSTLQRIEAALLALDAAGLQRLGDAYLYQKGYTDLTSVGLAPGVAKTTTGRPDTLIKLPDGRFIMVEYTTQRAGLTTKLRNDYLGCLDKSKTGVPVTRIAEVILCHTGKLAVKDELALVDLAQAQSVPVRTIGLQRLANALYSDFPQLAADFLGIEVDTGQIRSVDDFVTLYERAAVATPLSTTFRHREAEAEKVLAALEAASVVFVTGRQGTGKTRLALECCRRYREHRPDTTVLCVLNRGTDLYRDLRHSCSEPGHYLIMVDDANRTSRFEYVLELLREKRSDRTIVVLATVRDYARDRLYDLTRPMSEPVIVELEAMTDPEIRDLVQTQLNIQNDAYLERITSIAAGNPRLAMMAGKVARDSGTLRSLSDATALYDGYYDSIRRDIEAIADPLVLRVAAVIAFWRAVDRADTALMAIIETVFLIEPAGFWNAVRKLHDIEIVDLYENDVVRISDQVLATYLFYVAVFRDKTIDLVRALTECFPQWRARFVDALTPIFTAFGPKGVVETLRRQVAEARRVFEARDDGETVLELVDVFWFLEPAAALSVCRDAIIATEVETDTDFAKLSFQPQTSPSASRPPLRTLANFGDADTDQDRRIAVELLIEYLERKPSLAPAITRVLIDAFGVTHRSHFNDFAVTRSAATELVAQSDKSRRSLAVRLLLAFARSQLLLRFQRSEPGRGSSIKIFDFTVPATPAWLSVRKLLWDAVLVLYDDADRSGDVLDLLKSYATNAADQSGKDVTSAEAPMIWSFMTSRLNPSHYVHSEIVASYAAALARVGVPCDASTVDRFRTKETELADILFSNRSLRANVSWEEFESRRRERIGALAEQLDASGLRDTLARADKIGDNVVDTGKRFELQEGVAILLQAVAVKSPSVFREVMVAHVRSDHTVELDPAAMASCLIATAGVDDAYRLLENGEYARRDAMLAGYFVALPADAVSIDHVPVVVDLYSRATAGFLHHTLPHMLKLRAVAPDVMQRLVKIVTDRSDSEAGLGYALEHLFIRYRSFGVDLLDLVDGDTDLLTRAFLVACASDVHTDPSGEIFDRLLTVDDRFVEKWIGSMQRRYPYLNEHDDPRNYAFLWRRSDAEAIVRRVVAALRDPDTTMISSYPHVFFIVEKAAVDAPAICARQDGLLDSWIVTKSDDDVLMELVFSIAAELGLDRVRGRLGTFLAHNQNLSDFEALRLTPRQRSYWGSAVPMYEEEAAWWESFLPLVGSAPLLRHRLVLERRIQDVRDTIEREKRREFLRD